MPRRCAKALTPRLTKTGSIITGEIAHIVGRKPGAARSAGAVKTDDTYNNLILLCPNHHTEVDKGEADYPVDLLRQWKANWEQRVESVLLKSASVEGGSPLEMRMWAYFNFGTILDLYRETHEGNPLPSRLAGLQTRGVVNADGFPIDGLRSPGTRRTVFETWPQDQARSLQQFYSEMVEQIIRARLPLDLDEIWGISKLRAMLYPGATAFINRGLWFKKAEDNSGITQRRNVRCEAHRVELVFQIDTWNMYASSAVDVHFTGNTHTAALLLVRSAVQTSHSNRGKLTIKATPIALGMGFCQSRDKTPSIAYAPG